MVEAHAHKVNRIDYRDIVNIPKVKPGYRLVASDNVQAYYLGADTYSLPSEILNLRSIGMFAIPTSAKVSKVRISIKASATVDDETSIMLGISSSPTQNTGSSYPYPSYIITSQSYNLSNANETYLLSYDFDYTPGYAFASIFSDAGLVTISDFIVSYSLEKTPDCEVLSD